MYVCMYILWYVRLTESKCKILILRIMHYVCEVHYVITFVARAESNTNGSYREFAGPIGQGKLVFKLFSWRRRARQ